jgi:hypothetical protein
MHRDLGQAVAQLRTFGSANRGATQPERGKPGACLGNAARAQHRPPVTVAEQVA